MIVTNIRDIRVCDKLKWTSDPETVYTVTKVDYDNCVIGVEWDSGSGIGFDNEFCAKKAIRDGDIRNLHINVKDTRLARKLYPNAEKLDNGMLRIRS